ncbi:MAG: BrnT family toxin [Rhizobiales bacterium]|nr:BrnT family toxin [Hyphomicrobiales bacterium]
MLDLARIEGFDWDNGNSRKSEAKHSVSREEAEQVFFDEPVVIVPDIAHSAVEERFHAFGKTVAGRLLQVSFTTRAGGRLIRVISARDMSAKERARYA